MHDGKLKPRMDGPEHYKLAPETSAALMALGKAVDDSGLEKPLTELVKLRVSQINGCAYCVQLHLNVARKLGVAAAKLEQTVVWRETGVFSVRERAALQWAEALTLMAGRGVPDAAFEEVSSQFDRSELAFLTAAVANINAWNRIAGSLHYTPPASTAA
ncbi:MAG: carboxymuconolactone decarboxylase family protein [Pseudomonadota bacterium]